jgi:hypothetical protein
MAQALGDGLALKQRKLPLIRIHLKDSKKAIERFVKDLKSF